MVWRKVFTFASLVSCGMVMSIFGVKSRANVGFLAKENFLALSSYAFLAFAKVLNPLSVKLSCPCSCS